MALLWPSFAVTLQPPDLAVGCMSAFAVSSIDLQNPSECDTCATMGNTCVYAVTYTYIVAGVAHTSNTCCTRFTPQSHMHLGWQGENSTWQRSGLAVAAG